MTYAEINNIDNKWCVFTYGDDEKYRDQYFDVYDEALDFLAANEMIPISEKFFYKK